MNVETGECQFLRLLFFDMLMDWFHLLIVSPKDFSAYCIGV